jgi:hypothetical protein
MSAESRSEQLGKEETFFETKLNENREDFNAD